MPRTANGGEPPKKHETAGAKTLEVNLRRLMAEHETLGSAAKVASKAGIDATMVNRILRRATSPSLGTLEAIAGALGVELWVLLYPQDAAPAIEWPFELIDKRRYLGLTEVERGAAQGAMGDKIGELERARAARAASQAPAGESSKQSRAA